MTDQESLERARVETYEALLNNLRDCGIAFRMIRDAVSELSGAVPLIRERDIGPPSYMMDAEEIITGFAAALTAVATEARVAERRAIIQELTACPENLRVRLKQHPSYSCECALTIATWLATTRRRRDGRVS